MLELLEIIDQMWQLQTDRPRRRPLANDNIQREVLHGRVEHFFNHAAQSMDLIYEEDIPCSEIGQDCGQIPRAFNCGARGYLDAHTHLIGHYMRECGLSQARRTIKEDVIQGLAALPRRLDKNP